MSEDLNVESKVGEVVDDSDDLQSRINELTAQLAQEQDKSLRARAELENFRKRKEQEVETFRQYANEKLILEFLPVLDSFDRALQSNGDENKDAMIEGVQLIYKQFESTLDKLGVTPFESLNNRFDPSLHMAVSQEDADGVESETVVKEFQRGYKLHDRIIRPAMVVVAK